MTLSTFLEHRSLNIFYSWKSAYFWAATSTERAIVLKKYLRRSTLLSLRTSFARILFWTCSMNSTFLILNILCYSIDYDDYVDYDSASRVNMLSLNRGCRLIYIIVILWLGLITNILEKKCLRVFNDLSLSDLFFFLISWGCNYLNKSYPSAHLFSISFSKFRPLNG